MPLTTAWGISVTHTVIVGLVLDPKLSLKNLPSLV